jgi:hypothetical protein
VATKEEIVKILRIIIQIPAIYHSREELLLPSAISERARNKKISAKTAIDPSIALTIAENFNAFIN